jgi:HTH-type transcriptional regulator / antitoxin HigA
METLKFKKIKSTEQYNQYCNILEELCSLDIKSNESEEEIDVLTILIEKYDDEIGISKLPDPIKMLKYLMGENKLIASQLAEILGVSKGLISDILKYKKGLSKEVIRKLSENFKVKQETFNRPYKLQISINSRLKNASVMNTEKVI